MRREAIQKWKQEAEKVLAESLAKKQDDNESDEDGDDAEVEDNDVLNT